MAGMNPKEMAQAIGSGLLSFPVTHFTKDNAFDEGPYRQHISWLLEHKPAGLFAAGGTGEFFSLAFGEFAQVVRAAVEEAAGKAPVLAGCGYGTQMAIEFAKAAEAAGADGILLLPPYLVHGEPGGWPLMPKLYVRRPASASFSITATTSSSRRRRWPRSATVVRTLSASRMATATSN